MICTDFFNREEHKGGAKETKIFLNVEHSSKQATRKRKREQRLSYNLCSFAPLRLAIYFVASIFASFAVKKV